MPRAIVEYALQGTQGPSSTDGYTDKLVKYVPADVIAAWTAVVGTIKAAQGLPGSVLLVCFVIGLALTAWWTWRNFNPATPQPRKVMVKQVIVSTIAFGVWVLAIGDLNDYLASVHDWNAAYAKLILIFFTLVSGRI